MGLVMVGVVAVILGTAGFVFAQSTGPTAAPTAQPGYGSRVGQSFGSGMMGAGRGMRGGMGMMGSPAAGTQTGFMHAEMMAAFAQKLGLTVTDLNAQLAQGQTMAQIAAAKGYTAEQFTSLMTEVRSQTLDQAVTNGQITQAQADWMKQRGAGMMGGSFGNMDCPFFDQTNP
jgi:hypothetical protein